MAPLRCSLGAVALALALACDPAQEAPPPELLIGDQVEYRLSVDWQGSALEDGHFVFTTDLGYKVGVSSWFQGNTSIQLVPCESQRSHAYDNDVSHLSLSLGQDLTRGESFWLGAAPMGDGPYCEVHSILGRVAEHDLDPDGAVTRIQGWFQPPGGGERVEFEALSRVPISVLPPLLDGEWLSSLNAGEARVQLTWLPTRAFDGLEIETLSELDLSYEVGQQLGQGAHATWSLGQ